MLITKEDLLTRQYAADMIIDMMKCQRIAEAVVRFVELHSSLYWKNSDIFCSDE